MHVKNKKNILSEDDDVKQTEIINNMKAFSYFIILIKQLCIFSRKNKE